MYLVFACARVGTTEVQGQPVNGQTIQLPQGRTIVGQPAGTISAQHYADPAYYSNLALYGSMVRLVADK